MTNLQHSIHISHTPSLPHRQICAMNVMVSRTYSVVAEVAPGDFQPLLTEDHSEYSIPTLFFSFDELRSSRCYYMCERMLLSAQPRMHPTTRRFLVQKIVGYGMNLVSLYSEAHVNFGFVVDVKLDVENFRLADEEELAVYRQFDDMDDKDVENSQYKGVEKGRYNVGESKEEVITCSVCLEDLTPGVELNRLPCSHIFHTGCINPWLERNASCPNCRTKLQDNEVSVVVAVRRLLIFLNDGRV